MRPTPRPTPRSTPSCRRRKVLPAARGSIRRAWRRCFASARNTGGRARSSQTSRATSTRRSSATRFSRNSDEDIVMKTLTLLAAAALAALVPARAADGDDYPRRPVKLIIPNAPGSSNDVLTRILAQYLGQELGQNVVVENDAGASGQVGM